MGIGSAGRKLRWSLAHRGWAGTLRALGAAAVRKPKAAVVHPFDQRYGTDTGGVIGGGSLGTGSRNDAFITAYAGVSPSRLNRALDRWAGTLEPGETLEQFTFVDLGCGKGRAMLLASQRPFRAVAGVELNPELAELAQQNVLIFEGSGEMRVPVEVRRGDATEIAYPGVSLLLFIYNSFGVPVVRAVLDALETHVRRTGARVDLLFQNEGPEMPLRTDPRLRLLWTGTLPLEAEERAGELVGSDADVTSLYRWR